MQYEKFLNTYIIKAPDNNIEFLIHQIILNEFKTFLKHLQSVFICTFAINIHITIIQFIERHKLSEVSIDGFHKVTVWSIRYTTILISSHITNEECLRTRLRSVVLDYIDQKRLKRANIKFNVFWIPLFYCIMQNLDFSIQFIFGLFIIIDDELKCFCLCHTLFLLHKIQYKKDTTL